MRDIFRKKGYETFIETITNQIFIVLNKEQYESLSKKVAFSFWELLGNERTVVRFASSWATTQEQIDELEKVL